MQTYLLQAMLKQMELVRKKVLEKPGTLPTLMMQLQTRDTDSQIKAAEMLFCVVGQGPGRDVAATRQVSPDDHMPTALHDLCAEFTQVMFKHAVCYCYTSNSSMPWLRILALTRMWGAAAAGTRQQPIGSSLDSHARRYLTASQPRPGGPGTPTAAGPHSRHACTDHYGRGRRISHQGGSSKRRRQDPARSF